MVIKSRQKAAIQAIHHLIKQLKTMAGMGNRNELFDFLDHVEYLPALILEKQDQTIAFEVSLKQICENYKLDHIFSFYTELVSQFEDLQQYTIVLNIGEGTYVSQLNAKNEYDALFEWMKLSKYDGVPDFNNRKKALFLEELKDELAIPVELNGLNNTFCSTILIDNELHLFTIVKQ